MRRTQYDVHIGYDVDETLLSGVADGFHYYLKRRGHRFDPRVFRQSGGSWNDALGCSSADISRIFAEYFCSKECSPPAPIPGAFDVLDSLRKSVSAQHIVTARATDTRAKTIAQLEKYFPLCITGHWFEYTCCKHKAIGARDIGIFVEDSAVEAEIILRESTHPVWVILFINFRADPCLSLNHERLIRLKVSDEVEPHMPRSTWRPLWRRAWRETHEHINTLLELHYRRTSLCTI